ncbi:MAG: response regulator, partial [Lachnospiraceae bacterium]|nr:response regulator [Lachnospiraceae bacterium]
MPKATILVVEDDASVQNLITTALKMYGYDTLTAGNGQNAVMQAASHSPDVIFLDLGLPDMDGVEVIRKVRSWSELPIIVISARSEEADKIEALDAGADDYLTKPFSVEELLARLRVSLRRLPFLRQAAKESPVFTNGSLVIDYAAETVTLDGKELHLTPIEYKLITLLSHNEGKVLTYSY